MQEPDRLFKVSNKKEDADTNGIITLAMLRRKTYRSPKTMSESNLLLTAKTVMKNCKIAYAISKKLLDTEGNLRSGCNLTDVLNL